MNEKAKLKFLTAAIVLLIAFAACNGNGEIPEPLDLSPPRTELEELSATIVAAGTFWEDWWGHTGPFSHSGESVGVGYSPLLPESGLASLYELMDYLLQLYTESALDEMHLPFKEIDGVLYFADARFGTTRFDWNHVSFEQLDENTVIASVLYGYFAFEEGTYVDLTFHMLDGRIDRIDGANIIIALLDEHLWAQDDFEPWNEFAAALDDGLLFIAPAVDSLLASFIYFHEVDYTELINIRDGVQSEPWGDRIAIWSSVPLFQLEIINIEGDFDPVNEELIFIPTASHGMIDVLYPGQVYLINNYVGVGTLPWSGLTFLDEQGRRHHFFMQHDNSDSPNVFRLGRFYVDDIRL